MITALYQRFTYLSVFISKALRLCFDDSISLHKVTGKRQTAVILGQKSEWEKEG